MNAAKRGTNSWSSPRSRSALAVVRPGSKPSASSARTQFHLLSFEGPDANPKALASLLSHGRHWPESISVLAERASRTARDYAWDRVIDRRLFPVAEAEGSA